MAQGTHAKRIRQNLRVRQEGCRDRGDQDPLSLPPPCVNHGCAFASTEQSPGFPPCLMQARNSQGPKRWHMFEEKREAVMAIEAAVFPKILNRLSSPRYRLFFESIPKPL